MLLNFAMKSKAHEGNWVFMAGYLNSGNQTTEPWSGFAKCIVNLYLWIMELQNWKSMGLPASLFVLIDTAWLGLILSMRQASADDM